MKKNISNIVTILAALIIVVAGVEAINIYMHPMKKKQELTRLEAHFYS